MPSARSSSVSGRAIRPSTAVPARTAAIPPLECTLGGTNTLVCGLSAV
jgi:hypothetical protein